jgi:hypothetical protein
MGIPWKDGMSLKGSAARILLIVMVGLVAVFMGCCCVCSEVRPMDEQL